jgi:hypothetical protein
MMRFGQVFVYVAVGIAATPSAVSADVVHLVCQGKYPLRADIDTANRRIIIKYENGSSDIYENGRRWSPATDYKKYSATDEVNVTEDRLYFKSQWFCIELLQQGGLLSCNRNDVRTNGGYLDRYSLDLVRDETRFKCSVVKGPAF